MHGACSIVRRAVLTRVGFGGGKVEAAHWAPEQTLGRVGPVVQLWSCSHWSRVEGPPNTPVSLRVPIQVQPFDEHLPDLHVDLVVDAKTAFTWYDAK